MDNSFLGNNPIMYTIPINLYSIESDLKVLFDGI